MHQREGLSVKSILASGRLPFKINKMWTVNRSDKDIILFDLLEINLTAVYTLDHSNGALIQVPAMNS